MIEGERLYITGNIRHELINDRLKVDGIRGQAAQGRIGIKNLEEDRKRRLRNFVIGQHLGQAIMLNVASLSLLVIPEVILV